MNDFEENLLEDKRKIFLMLYSARAFNLAKEACDYIIEHSLEKGDRLFYPLFSSIAVNYSRPFKRSRVVGALPEKMVPKEFMRTHGSLISARDTMFAHTDGDTQPQAWGPINQIRYKKEGIRIVPISMEVVGSPAGFSDAAELCTILQKKCLYHVRRLQERHRKLFPKKDGEYIMSISEASDAFLVETEPLDAPNESI